MVGSAVGQMNSLPWSVQTGATSPGQDGKIVTTVLEVQKESMYAGEAIAIL